MRLSGISVAGFRGVRDRLDLNVEDGFLVITGRNGSGKSTLCDAIEFVLTGKMTRFEERKETKESINDYLWWRGDGEASERFVELTFTRHGGEQLKLRRQPGMESVDLLDGLSAEFCEGRGSSTDWVDDLVSTMFIRDETIAAMSIDLGETQRFALVERALGVTESTKYEFLIADSIKKLQGRLVKLEREYSAAQESIVSRTAELARLQEATVSRGSISEAFGTLRRELSRQFEDSVDVRALEGESAAFRERLRNVERLRNELDDEIRHREDLQRQRLDSQTTKTNADIASASADIAAIKARLELLESQIADLRRGDERRATLAQLVTAGESTGLADGHCPLCGSDVSPERFESEILRIKAVVGDETRRYATLVAEREQRKTALVALQERQQQLRAFVESIHAAAQRVDDKIRQLRDSLATQTALADPSSAVVTRWLEEKNGSLQRIDRAIADVITSRMLDRAAEFENELEDMKRNADRLAQEVGRITEAEDKLKGLGRTVKQVSKEIVDERLATAEPLLVELYRRLRPHSEWRDVSFKIRGEIRKYLSFRVGDGINPSFVFSSGQRRAAGLAFLLAVHLARNWCRLNTLVLDDPVQHIDDFRALHLVEVLSAIRKTGRQIICTVEDGALADLLVRRLQVAPLTGGSRVELKHDPVRGVTVESERPLFGLPKNVLQTA